jgi:hypothetical protein
LCGKNKNSLHRFCTGFLCQIIYITICHYNKKMVEAAGVEPVAYLVLYNIFNMLKLNGQPVASLFLLFQIYSPNQIPKVKVLT